MFDFVQEMVASVLNIQFVLVAIFNARITQLTHTHRTSLNYSGDLKSEVSGEISTSNTSMPSLEE